ncbi:unnamed protein product [Symbiodinium pilosum]|uniref:Ubiquitin-like domain-containing protein n=1 Tax=Symbiodinium pilosum TaxID=2952 RepID=A0A812M4R2_SYMPI|nr:unnamed protein product [Symbiodinium pilosum]
MRCCRKAEVSPQQVAPEAGEAADAEAPETMAEPTAAAAAKPNAAEDAAEAADATAECRSLEIMSATTGALLVTLTLPVNSVVKDVKGQLEVALGIKPEFQQLLANEELLSEDQPQGAGPLALVRLVPQYNEVTSHDDVPLEDTEHADRPNVASMQNDLAQALGAAGEMLVEGDVSSYQVHLEVVIPENGEQAQLFWTEITTGMGLCTLFSCYVEPGAKVLLALEETSGAPALPTEKVWVPVIFPQGPKCKFRFTFGAGQPPRGFLSLKNLKPLPKEDWTWQSVTAPAFYRLYS